jgi:hypothetical protein
MLALGDHVLFVHEGAVIQVLPPSPEAPKEPPARN